MKLLFILYLLLKAGAPLLAENRPASIDFQQKIGDPWPEDLLFRNEEGAPVKLRSLMASAQPTVLALLYFHCQTLCPLTMNGLVKAANEMDPQVIPGFQTIAVSIDPKDTPAEASQRKRTLLQRSNSALNPDTLHMLTGDAENIRRLADAVGFRYRYDEASAEYQHPSGLVVLSPDGHISAYLFGIEFDPKRLQETLALAAQNRRGRLLDQLVMACFRYNSQTGTYTIRIYAVMRILAILLLLGGGIAIAIWERRRRLPGLQ